MAHRNVTLYATSRLERVFGFFLLRAGLILAMVCWCGYSADAKQKKHKKTAHSSKSASKKHAPAKPANEVPLKASDYPAEISGRITAYNAQVNEINAVRKKNPKLAKARGEVLQIERQSFEIYTGFMASYAGREADKIRKTVAANAWYKGMPQIAFVVSMGLPDDVQTVPVKDGSGLKLFYKSGSFYFEKGRLRSFDKAGS